MSPELVGLVATGILLLVLFLGVPVATSMILVGMVGLTIVHGIGPGLTLATLSVPGSLSDYTLSIIPVFLLMGEFADISGMMKGGYRAASIWLGNIPGGLAMASILGAAAFSAVSGSSMACAAIMTRIALPHLLEHKYDPILATGALAAGGTLGNLIPPGVNLVFYCVLTEASLGRLFIACVIPGITLTLMYMVQIYIQCKLNPRLARATSSTSWKEKLWATKSMAPIVIVFTMVLGGIQFGVYTPNEAASFATVFIFIYAVVRRTMNGQVLVQAIKNTIINTGMACAIVVGANIFSIFIAISGLPQMLANWIVGLNLSSLQVIILIMVVYFILGIPLNPLTMLLLTIPILMPILAAYDIDLIWFGVLVIVQLELANLTPPVGMNLFIVAAMGKPFGISMNTVFRGAYPFCGTMVVFNILLIAFPQIAMFLVTQMKG